MTWRERAGWAERGEWEELPCKESKVRTGEREKKSKVPLLSTWENEEAKKKIIISITMKMSFIRS